MFQGMINKIKEVFNSMFNKNTIENKMQVDVAISSTMQEAIERFINIYQNNPPWRNDSKGIYSMNLGAGIASEFAKLVTIEFKSEISNNDFLNKEYQVVIDNIRNNVELACAGGGIVFKPYLSNGHLEVDIVQADAIYPVSFNSRGEMTAVILPETKTIGEWTYTRLEYHSLNGTEYTIMNKAFKKKNYNTVNSSMDSNLGDEIQLTEVEEWQNLAPQVLFHNVERPLFSYFKMPNRNTIDLSSPLGVSVYERVAGINGLLQQADEQFSRIVWEFKSKETAIHVDVDLLGKDTSDNLYMPTGMERLYRKLSIDSMASGSKQIETYSPDIRDISLFNGLNQLLRTIEFQVGLEYGSLSEAAETAKTATEIKISRQRSYQTVKDIQNSLRVALETLIYGLSYLGQIGGLPVTAVNLDTDISYDFDDSIIVDKESELLTMFNDVSSNLIRPEFYIAKRYGVSIEEALKMMPEQVEITPSPFSQE